VTSFDAVVVGSGPNGLAAAVTLARAGLSVHVVEGAKSAGGGCRTEELTLPGFRHDVCSAVHPLVALSPFFADPAFNGLRARLAQPSVPFAHPLDHGGGAAAFRSLEATADALGADGPAYASLLGPMVDAAEDIATAALSPMRGLPANPVALARFGWEGVRSLDHLVTRFRSEPARALLAGVAAHAERPLSAPVTAGFALLLTLAAHAVGWPVVSGGSGAIADALVTELQRLGGEVETGRWVARVDELPASTAVVLDVAPAALPGLVGDALPEAYQRAMGRFRSGPGVCKVDWSLSGPVPWSAEVCRWAGTVHLGGTAAEVARSEADVWAGRHSERPFCIVVQPGVVDPTRAPDGAQTLWGYCHVPNGSDQDRTAAIEAQVERFAPGFADLVLDRRTVTASHMALDNPNYVGGDIGGGANDLVQIMSRPVPAWNPYRTPTPGVYLCSASTPPGGGSTGCAACSPPAPCSTTGSGDRRRSPAEAGDRSSPGPGVNGAPGSGVNGVRGTWVSGMVNLCDDDPP
jgi:phytoene dehydrogenase-like protein